MNGDESGAESGAGLAPVIPLFGSRSGSTYPRTADEVRRTLNARHGLDIGDAEGESRRAAVREEVPARSGSKRSRVRFDTDTDTGTGTADGDRADVTGQVGSDAREAAERGLLKKLRARQLSVSEARSYLVQQELGADSVDEILTACLDRGYLDDARLAEQVVYAGVDRKGQGHQAIAQNLAKRGVPREVADAALAELPDDDAERALEYARTKAGSLQRLERDVALRRLAGQLARRGYGGSVALTAARTALDEAPTGSSGVRFR